MILFLIAGHIHVCSLESLQSYLAVQVIPVEGPPSVKVTRHMLESTCRSDDRRFSSNFVPVSTSLQQSVSVLDTQDENIAGTYGDTHYLCPPPPTLNSKLGFWPKCVLRNRS